MEFTRNAQLLFQSASICVDPRYAGENPKRKMAEIDIRGIAAQDTSIPQPETTRAERINWTAATGVVTVHLLALLALDPWFFNWTGVALVFIGNYIFCSIGIGAGYHRCLTHKSFRCSKTFEHFLALLGLCSLQDSPLRWVAVHRAHHVHADDQPDPHSPLVTLFWGHMGWVLTENTQFNRIANYEKFVRDLLQDKFYRALERNGLWAWIYVIHAALFYVAGFAAAWLWTGQIADAVQFGLSVLVWGVFVRTVYTWHITWGVNSIAHRWGYRNYATGENSRNNWIIGLATNGEGWHNNHHGQPRSAAHGFHRWWELDITYLTILLWKRVGLVWNVIPPRERTRTSKIRPV